jgi:hypothetical protein
MSPFRNCPLCNSDGVDLIYSGDYYTEFEFRIQCPDCSLILPANADGILDVNGNNKWVCRLEYVERWNTRVVDKARGSSDD